MPIRLRLTLGFTLVMALAFASIGFEIYTRSERSLDRTVQQGLQTRAAEVAALVTQSETGLKEGAGTWGAGFAQILARDGRVFDASPGLGSAPVLSRTLLDRALQRPVTADVTVFGQRVRVLAQPTTAQGRRLVTVVGTSLAVRDGALTGLRRSLLIGGPFALLLAALAGYALAAAALRPVENMRARAAALSTSLRGDRLPVPGARDELGRLGTTLNELLDRLERTMERERRFVADASHELRTPLALLRAELELALDSPRPHSMLEDALRSAALETDRLVQLSEDLLLLARIDQNSLPIRLQLTRLDDLFEGVAARFQRRARDLGREIVHDGKGLSVMSDPVRIEQALGNLIDNALRYGRGAVTVAAVPEEGSVALHVRDDGTGIPPEFTERAFERFSRLNPSRAAGGTGLGLAIVAEIARAHGGSAGVEGADFWLVFPDSQEAHSQSTMSARAKSFASHAAS
jgi:signal transduction histidine kinase